MAHGSLSHFKATLARKIQRDKKRNARSDRNSSNSKNPGKKIDFNLPKLSESEHNKVKADIRKKAKSERKKEIIKISIGLVITLIIISLIFYYLFGR